MDNLKKYSKEIGITVAVILTVVTAVDTVYAGGSLQTKEFINALITIGAGFGIGFGIKNTQL